MDNTAPAMANWQKDRRIRQHVSKLVDLAIEKELLVPKERIGDELARLMEEADMRPDVADEDENARKRHVTRYYQHRRHNRQNASQRKKLSIMKASWWHDADIMRHSAREVHRHAEWYERALSVHEESVASLNTDKQWRAAINILNHNLLPYYDSRDDWIEPRCEP